VLSVPSRRSGILRATPYERDYNAAWPGLHVGNPQSRNAEQRRRHIVEHGVLPGSGQGAVERIVISARHSARRIQLFAEHHGFPGNRSSSRLALIVMAVILHDQPLEFGKPLSFKGKPGFSHDTDDPVHGCGHVNGQVPGRAEHRPLMN
jgi:hypothetical protein